MEEARSAPDLTLGERIAHVRKHRHLSREDLGKRLGIGWRVLGMYERDERQPKASMLRRIAVELGVSADYLLGLTPSYLIAQDNGAKGRRRRSRKAVEPTAPRQLPLARIVDGRARDAEQSFGSLRRPAKMG